MIMPIGLELCVCLVANTRVPFDKYLQMKDVYTLCLMRMLYIVENDACSYFTGFSAETVTPQPDLSMSSKVIPFWSRIILIDLSFTFFNSYKSSVLFAGANPDQTPQNAASDHGLHCLLTDYSVRIRTEMENKTRQRFKRILTGPIDTL